MIHLPIKFVASKKCLLKHHDICQPFSLNVTLSTLSSVSPSPVKCVRGGATHWTRHLKSRFGYSLGFAPSGVPAVPEPVHAIPAPEQGERRFGNTQATAVEQTAGADTKEKPDV